MSWNCGHLIPGSNRFAGSCGKTSISTRHQDTMKRSRTHRTTAAVLLARNGYRGVVAVDLEGLHAFRSTANTAILTESPALCSRRTLHAISSASGWSRSLMRTTSVPEEKKSQHSSSPTGRMLLKLRRYASETPAPAGNADQDKEKEPPNEGRIKSFIKKYGPVGVVTYFGIIHFPLSFARANPKFSHRYVWIDPRIVIYGI